MMRHRMVRGRVGTMRYGVLRVMRGGMVARSRVVRSSRVMTCHLRASQSAMDQGPMPAFFL